MLRLQKQGDTEKEKKQEGDKEQRECSLNKVVALVFICIESQLNKYWILAHKGIQ